MIFRNTQDIFDFASYTGIRLSLLDGCSIKINYSNGQPPEAFVGAVQTNKQELVKILSKPKPEDPKKELIEQYFGKTRELTPEESQMVDVDVVLSYYSLCGATLQQRNEIRNELEAMPELMSEIATKIRARKNKPPSSLCDIPIDELKKEAGEDWQELVAEPDKLYAFADAISKQRLMEQGIVPDSYTAITHCKACGDVYVTPALVNNGNVLGCPWCWNRAKGLPILQPN